MVIASVQVVICCLSIPMCKYNRHESSVNISRLTYHDTDIFGKRNRSFMQRYDLLKLTHLW